MASPSGARERPLSPHLQIYKPLVNMVMSIVHRITGGALYVGSMLLAWWLIALAQGERSYAFVVEVFSHPLGKLILVGYTWALVHHMLGGMRHLYWDTGRGFSLSTVKLLSWLSLVGSLSITAALWGIGLHMRGAI